MILTPNYSLEKPEPADNLKASQGFFSRAFDTLDSNLKTVSNVANQATTDFATKAPLLAPMFRPASVGGAGVVVRGLLGQTANLAEFQNSAGVAETYINNFGGVQIGRATNFGAFLNVATAGDAASKGLVVRGAASQTANLAEFQDSAGAVVAEVHPVGGIGVRAAVSGSGAVSILSSTGFPTLRPLIVRGAVSQSANLVEFQNSAGTALLSIRSNGALGGSASNSPSIQFTSDELIVSPGATTYVGMKVRGAASQTGNLQNWENSAGTVLTRIASTGSIWARLWDGVAEHLNKELLIGAVDSGGSGYRMVRVFN